MKHKLTVLAQLQHYAKRLVNHPTALELARGSGCNPHSVRRVLGSIGMTSVVRKCRVSGTPVHTYDLSALALA